MTKLTDTLIGISVNKMNADKKFQTRDTVFKRGSNLNSFSDFHSSSKNTIGYRKK